MKKLLAGIFIGILLMTTIAAFGETRERIDVIFGRVKLVVDGVPINEETLTYNNTTYVPLRAAAEALGANVEWDGETNTAILTNKAATQIAAAPTQTPVSNPIPMPTPKPEPTPTPTPMPTPTPTPEPEPTPSPTPTPEPTPSPTPIPLVYKYLGSDVQAYQIDKTSWDKVNDYPSSGSFYMAGVNYTNGVTFYNDTSNKTTSAYYNLEGKFNFITGIYGPVDGVFYNGFFN